MATTHGYGGEFSSDEDIDKLEQQTDRASKFDSHSVKPSKSQIEHIIANFRATNPTDEEVNLTDDVLAGMLDYFKTPRGPIVDSTRNLYKKIILRLIRGDQEVAINGDKNGQQATNGNSNGASVVNNNNNNNDELILINKRQPMFESPSSDEDEPMPPASQEPILKKKDDKLLEPMEVDAEPTPVAPFRVTETIDIATTEEEEEEDDDDEDDDSETEKSNNSETEESDADVLDTTASIGNGKGKPLVTSTPINFKVTPKRVEIAASKKSATKESIKKPSASSFQEASGVQKPYRRSQRVAATRLSRSPASTSSPTVSSSGGQVIRGVEISGEKQASLKGTTMRYLGLAILFVLVAYSLYHFKSDILSSSQRVMRKVNIKF